MSFSASTLCIAGQDSDVVDIRYPSCEASTDTLVSHTSSKQMYGNSESIKSWINTIDCANKSSFDPSDSEHFAFEFATHPFRICRPDSPLSSGSDVSFCFAASAWAPEVVASSYYDDSDESRSESSASDDAQYIAIPYDSPWYRRPSPSPGPISAHELSTAMYTLSCSSDVRQAIAQQELLLAIFHEELRRIVPHADGPAYDSDWLEGMDADLVLAPLDTYADLCWESTVSERASLLCLDRPLADVPTGFDDFYGAR